MLMMAPPDCAYSAPKKFVCILNSCTASTDGVHFRSVAPVFCSVVLTIAPSTSTSEVELRVPFATKFVLLGLIVPAAPFTPGVRFKKLRGFLPIFGSAVMYRFSMTCPRVAMVVFRSGAWLRTSTAAVSPPTSNDTSNVACCWTARGMWVWVYVLNPLNSTLSMYSPGGRAVTTYRPALSVATVCRTLRSDSVTVTVAPGIAPPLASVTTPRTAAVYEDCAHATPETASAMQSKERARKRFWISRIAPPMPSGGREKCSRHRAVIRNYMQLTSRAADETTE